MSKILVIGDVHCKRSNLSEIRLFKDRLALCIEQSKPEHIVFLGDNLDKHDVLYTVCLNLMNDIIHMCREKSQVYLIVGNHDMIGPTEFLNDNHWLNSHKEWENVEVIDRVRTMNLSDIVCTFVPYVENGRFMEALNTNSHWQNSNIIFCHQEFKGCKMGAITSETGDEWPVDSIQIISGHIHSKQQPQDNIYYTGSALQHAFGESSDTTLLLIDGIDNYQEIDLDLPKKKIIYAKSDEIENIEFKNDNYKVVVSGSVSEYKQFVKSKKYKKMINDGIKITFKNTKKEIKDQNELIKSLNNEKTNFEDILGKLVDKENDEILNVDYKKYILNNK